MDIEQIIEDANTNARNIISQSGGIRREFEDGHPNSSTEATAEGGIRAMKMWMEVDSEFEASCPAVATA